MYVVEKICGVGYTVDMKILSLELNNFRNYKHVAVDFKDGLNILYGKNASGKTNMLESVYLCSIFHSPRTTKDKEMVLIGEDKATVSLVLQTKYKKQTINLQIDEKGKKRVLVNNIPLNRAGELFGVLGVVFFSPDEMKLVKESPQERRRFMDVGLSQQQRSYFSALQRYNKTVKQKNNLLKEWRGNRNIDDMLDVWDTCLAKDGAVIISKRLAYIETLNDAASKFHTAISSEKEKLVLSYESTIKTESSKADISDIEKQLYESIVNSRSKDKELGYCTVGPHRDDIKIEINGKDSRKFASQGQQRTVALALKLGEVIIYKNEIGEPPILLLDDVLSELDIGRQKLLLEMTEGFQTILTCTEYTLDDKGNRIHVSDGVAKNIN